MRVLRVEHVVVIRVNRPGIGSFGSMSEESDHADVALAYAALCSGLSKEAINLVVLAEPPFNVCFEVGTERSPSTVSIKHLKLYKARS